VNPVLFAGALAAPFLFEALPALATGESKTIRHAAFCFVNAAQCIETSMLLCSTFDHQRTTSPKHLRAAVVLMFWTSRQHFHCADQGRCYVCHAHFHPLAAGF
jgi:hypothetical protein